MTETLVAVGLGFVGVIITLWWNGRQARSQVIQIRSDTRRAVVNAYHAELSEIRDTKYESVKRIEQAMKEFTNDQEALSVPLVCSAECFDKMNFSDTMLLGGDVLGKVITAYGGLKQLPIHFATYGRVLNASDKIAVFSRSELEVLLRIERSTCDLVQSALSALQRERQQ